MRSRACFALLLFLSACAATTPSVPAAERQRFANLQRAAALPWADDGHCVVREAAHEWPALVERCFGALDHERIQFHDPLGRCAVASTGMAAMGVGLCILVAPEVVVGAVVITGAVVVAIAIQEALDAYSLRRRYPEEEATGETAKPEVDTTPASPDPRTKRSAQPENAPSGPIWRPPEPPDSLERELRPECIPRRVPPKGGHRFHNECADNVPSNAFRGANVLINGKAFDALQPATRTLWEVKTTAIETYNPFIQDRELEQQVEEGRRERDLAATCGYQFVIGVMTQDHKDALEELAPDLSVALMPWCRKTANEEHP
ncbi:DUF6310 domain-containing protein [Myxococcaceae bacterium GXIMD 01537]